MPEDDPELLARLAALEEEVKGEAAAARKKQDVAAAKQRELQRRAQEAEAARTQQAKAAARHAAPAEPRRKRSRDDDDHELAVDKAIAVAAASRLARSAKKELTRPRAEHEKSLLISGGVSLLFGPLGWLYAGAWREAVPAATGYLLMAALATKILPMFLLMPAMLVVMPLSAIAGIVYAWQYNRSGVRTRLFDKDKDDGDDGDHHDGGGRLLPPGRR